jgi:hypothetical protein
MMSRGDWEACCVEGEGVGGDGFAEKAQLRSGFGSDI